MISAQAIDEVNILQAAMTAMSDAVHALPLGADFVIVDGNRIPGVSPDGPRRATAPKA